MIVVGGGSVGKPKEGDPRASFAVLAGSGEGIKVTIERVGYDAATVADEMQAGGLPDELADKLKLGA